MKFFLRYSPDFPVDNVLEMAKETFNILKYEKVILFILSAVTRRDDKYNSPSYSDYVLSEQVAFINLIFLPCTCNLHPRV
jgi:hypothetical protein